MPDKINTTFRSVRKEVSQHQDGALHNDLLVNSVIEVLAQLSGHLSPFETPHKRHEKANKVNILVNEAI